jgi:hypothetical protein
MNIVASCVFCLACFFSYFKFSSKISSFFSGEIIAIAALFLFFWWGNGGLFFVIYTSFNLFYSIYSKKLK